MKLSFFFAAILSAVIATGQPVKSDVYTLKNLPVEKRETSERRNIFDGTGPVNDNLESHTTTIAPGKAAHAPHKHPEEELLIVKEGTVRVTINDKSQLLGPGSIAYVMPGDEHGAVNAGSTNATYYIIKYRAKKDSLKPERAVKAGGSFMVNWNDVAFNAHDKGGIRRFFEKPTGVFRRFEMHVTTLNTGLKSHEPHTHKAEEIVLMIEGNAEMQIGNEFKKAGPGDLIFLGSNVSHAIRNDDTKPCVYFAFQWD
jgi:(S)-ureidoglycine aminohydrolase